MQNGIDKQLQRFKSGGNRSRDGVCPMTQTDKFINQEFKRPQYERESVREERLRLDANCTNCSHMKMNECEYGQEENEDDLNGCDDHEYR